MMPLFMSIPVHFWSLLQMTGSIASNKKQAKVSASCGRVDVPVHSVTHQVPYQSLYIYTQKEVHVMSTRMLCCSSSVISAGAWPAFLGSAEREREVPLKIQTTSDLSIQSPESTIRLSRRLSSKPSSFQEVYSCDWCLLLACLCLLVLLHDILYMILCNVTRQRRHKEASSKASMWERRQRSKKTIKREIERLRMSYSIAIANMQLSKASLGSICFLWSDKKAVWEKKSTYMTLIYKQSRPAEPQLAAVVTQQALLQKIHSLHHHQLIFYQSTFQKVELTR